MADYGPELHFVGYILTRDCGNIAGRKIGRAKDPAISPDTGIKDGEKPKTSSDFRS
jgi:hypothetical protein